MKRRKGFSLVEVLVAIAVASLMLATAVGLLYALIEMDRTSREHLRLRTAAARLADRFRRDVHAAVRLTGPPAAAEDGAEAAVAWELELPPDRAVEYRLEEDSLLRTERAEGEAVKREWFGLPPHAAASIRISAGQSPPIVSLRIAPDGQSPAEPPAWRPVRIDAALALDHRFENEEER